MGDFSLRNWLAYSSPISFVYNWIQGFTGYSKALAEFSKKFDIPEDAYILDAGCNRGVISFALAPKVPYGKIVGFDKSKKAIKKARLKQNFRKQYNLEFLLGDVENMAAFKTIEGLVVTYEPESFDLIFASGVLEHADVYKGVTELSNYLKPGGTLVTIGMVDAPSTKKIKKTIKFEIHSESDLFQAYIKAGLNYPKKVNIDNEILSKYRMAIVGKKSQVA
jgi:SAM-dependent methyltransferase